MAVETGRHEAGHAARFEPPAWVVFVLLAVVFAAALFLRVRDVDLQGQLAEREFRSAIIAREMYLRAADDAPEWRLEVARRARDRQGALEPPVTEYLVSRLYLVAGGEDLRLARTLTASFWLAGGLFLFLLARRLACDVAALAATSYYLLLPLGVHLSRSFQPDSLMMLGLLATSWCVVIWFDRPNGWRFAAASVLAGLSVLVRPQVLFLIAAGFAALWLHRRSARARDGLVAALFGAIAALPSAAWYGGGLLSDDGELVRAGKDIRLWTQAEMTFRPSFLLTLEFWRDWALLAVSNVGLSVLIVAAIGLCLMRRGSGRALVLGWGAGYLALGLVFSYHIHTHGYYHAILTPVVGVPLGVAVARALHVARARRGEWMVRALVAGALLLAVPLYVTEFRERRPDRVFESAETARAVGERVGHSTNTAFVAYAYGLPLQYMGELAGQPWPRRGNVGIYRRAGDPELDVRGRLDALGIRPDFFIVTDLGRFERNHDDLAAFLEAHCRLLETAKTHFIYDRCTY